MIKKRIPRNSTLRVIMSMIANGQAITRTGLSLQTGIPASTISRGVQSLISQDFLHEEEDAVSPSGGRPRKILSLANDDEYAVVADIGRHHARVGIVRPGGVMDDLATLPFAIEDGPEACLARLDAAFAVLISRHPGDFRSIGIALPGPVEIVSGSVVRPSSMPGWDRFPVREHFEKRFDVPVAVDNDANCMALGETTFRKQHHQSTITVKAGTAIGAGLVVDRHIYHGAGNEAGDITHVRVIPQGGRPCSCGNVGCLETVASGAALVRILKEQGIEVSSTLDVVQLAQDAVPEVVTAIRRAGGYLGEVLAVNVNFFNPDAIYLGGIFSTLEPFVAAVQGRLYDNCHPLTTKYLVVEQTSLGVNAGLVGAGIIALDKAIKQDLDAVLHAVNEPEPNADFSVLDVDEDPELEASFLSGLHCR